MVDDIKEKINQLKAKAKDVKEKIFQDEREINYILRGPKSKAKPQQPQAKTEKSVEEKVAAVEPVEEAETANAQAPIQENQNETHSIEIEHIPNSINDEMAD
jgi:hypothetical protein